LPAPLRARWETLAPEELAERVRGASQRLAQANVPAGDFVEYFAARVSEDRVPGNFDHAADLFLTCALVRGEAAALRVFEHEYLANVGKAASRFHLSADELDELKQNLRQQFLLSAPGAAPKISEYSGYGPLSAWLRIAAVRAAIKIKKAQTDASSASVLDKVPALERDAELQLLSTQQKQAFREALRQAIASLDVREQNVLRQHHLDGLTLDQLGALYRVHRTTVAYWIERASERLHKRTRQVLMHSGGMTDSQCESLFRHAQSQFAVTLRSLFPEG
jgi:RNA polymerase sigma-70 factor (ECF subfamily)